MKIYINRIENRITFEVKTRYYLELLTPETLKLLGSTKSKITKDENGKNVHYIEITEVVLIHCNVVNNSYHQNSRVFTAQKKKFSIKDFFSKCDQILNGKLHFLCSACIHLFLVKHLDIYQIFRPKVLCFKKHLIKNFRIFEYGLLVKILLLQRQKMK